MRPTISQTSILVLQALLIAGGVTLAVVAITRLVGGPQLSISQITTNKQGTFDVTGQSSITTIPDEAEVRLGIVVNQPTVAAAQDQANQIINTITQQLMALGIDKEDIQTQNYSLNPNIDFSDGAQRITGYTANANVVVSLTDFTKLNQAIDAATAAGANQIGGITFSLSDERQAEVRNQARQEAIDDAKTNAQELAGLAGMRLGRIVNVWESPMNNNPPMPFAAREMSVAQDGSGGGAPTNVEPGSTTYDYQVTLSYETL